MVDGRNKKTSLEINGAILTSLNMGPKTAQNIAGQINSNWKTIKEYLVKLVEEREVKETSVGEKVSYYQRTKGDTYFNIHIDDGQREKFKAIFSAVLKEYKRRGEVPDKTHLAKSAVYVIRKLNQDGENLPTIWYLYGMVPLMVADLRQDYSTEHVFSVGYFGSLVRESVKEFIGKKSDEVQDVQYDGFNKELYIIKKEIMKEFSSRKFDTKKIASFLTEFLIHLDFKEDIDVFNFTERFASLFGQFDLLKKLDDEEIRRELLLTFDSLWCFIAIHQSIGSLLGYGYKKKDLTNFYLGSVIETKKYTAKEKLSNLESLYLSNFPEKLPEIKLSKGAGEIADILSDWS